jgi:hypothetical protein
MAKQGSSTEKVKRILLIVLGLGFMAALIYQFFFNGAATTPRRKPTPAGQGGLSAAATPNTSVPAAPKPRQMGAAAQQEAMMQALLSDTTPLNLRLASSTAGTSTPGNRGNIFAYYKEPPPPPPRQPDPPPIQLVSLQPQTAVAGTPRPITLVVTGHKIPADAQMLIDGSPRLTKRISETQLSTDISPGDYSLARGMNIEVKSKSNPAENSNSIQFVVQAAPEPQFIYKGRLGTLGQPEYNYAVVEINATKTIQRAKVGETVLGIWRVDAITADAMEVTLTQYDIKRRVQLQERSK